MLCKKCGCELGAIKMRTIVENDDTPDKETKVFVEQDLACKNKHCSALGVVADTVRNEIKIG